MNILVTGATGFLGGTLTKALVQDDQNVRILARKASNLHYIENLQVDIVWGSLENKTSLISALKNIDIVYHCAALSTDWGQCSNSRYKTD